jgi:Rnl2 family RNA ligase
MKFVKYSSIENSYRQRLLDKIVEEGHGKLEYVVQEKIHGANFSFWINDIEIKCAKRSGFIKDDEGFFDYKTVKEKYAANLQAMFEHFKKDGASTVVIYGELFGGEYPHPDVPRNHQKSVQKEIYYSPEQDFIAFDLKIDSALVSVDFANVIFKKFEIPYCKTLFRGSLEDCLKYPNKYTTTLPEQFGLPAIENNICEGNVIRPVESIFLWSGERLILKNKNEIFAEKSGSNKNKNPKPTKEAEPVSETVQSVLNAVELYINENRLRNVLSKIGQVSDKDFGKIMGLFTKDILEDFSKDEEDAFNKLDKNERKIVNKIVGQNAAKLIRGNFLNIVDGTY